MRPLDELAPLRRAAVYGHLVGDALGVPYEFGHHIDTVELRGHGTHNQPPGTWSDDGALMLALLDSLAQRRLRPRGPGPPRARLVGRRARTRPMATARSTSAAPRGARSQRLRGGTPAIEAGGTGERDQGNGSLMRILPIALVDPPDDDAELVERAHLASRVTHGHPNCQVACALYVLVARIAARRIPAASREAALALATDRLLAVYARRAGVRIGPARVCWRIGQA